MKRIFLLLIIAVLFGCSTGGLKQTVKDIEYGKEYDLSELFEISEDTSVSVNGKKSINMEALGMQEVSVDITKGDSTSTSTYTFNVVDRTAPYINVKNRELIQGKEFSASDFVDVEDNVDAIEDISIKVESGNVDKDALGEYTIVISATDKSKNSSSLQLTINVVEPKTTVDIGKTYTATGDGDKIEFTINEVVWQQEVYTYSKNMFASYFSNQDGETYFVVKMTIKNIGGDLTGDDIFDDWDKYSPYVLLDNTYKYNMYQLDTTSSVCSPYWSLQPLKSQDVFMLASIPDELVGKPYEVCFATADTDFVCKGN